MPGAEVSFRIPQNRREDRADAVVRDGRETYDRDSKNADSPTVHQLGLSRPGGTNVLQRSRVLLRKEVIQPHLPVRLPCYDFTPITDPTFDGSFLAVRPPASGVADFRGVTGGVYKARERIHPGVLIRDY
jgi:hypothetical protein